MPIPVARWVESECRILPDKPIDGSLIYDVNRLDPFSIVARPDPRYSLIPEEIQIFDQTGPFQGSPPDSEIIATANRLLNNG